MSRYKDMVIRMDTTYWGRNYGLMVIKDALRGKILWHKYVRHGPCQTVFRAWSGLNSMVSPSMA